MQARKLMYRRIAFTAAATAAAVSAFACGPVRLAGAVGLPANAPLIPGLRADAVVAAKARVAAGDDKVLPAYRKLIADADKALKAPIVAVTDKSSLLPPSGNRHD